MPALDDSGVFTFEAAPGKWLLLAEYLPTAEILRREVVVTDGPVYLAALRFAQVRPAPLLSEVTQDFDYLTRAPLGKIPGGMLGLDWGYLVAVANQTYNGPGFVNALHNQSIDQLGEDIVVSAREPNGVVQAIEKSDHRFFVGVQWHPEYMPQSAIQKKLFQGLVDVATMGVSGCG